MALKSEKLGFASVPSRFLVCKYNQVYNINQKLIVCFLMENLKKLFDEFMNAPWRVEESPLTHLDVRQDM